MNKHMSFNTWFLSALTLLAVSIAGCGRETIKFPDITAPYVTITSPALGAAGVAVGAPISATFSKLVNCPTASSFTVAVAGTGGAAVTPTSVTCSGSTVTTATFTPASPLVLHTLYTATITGVTDLAGNVMVSAYSWNFEAVAGPSVLSTTPTTGASGVVFNQVISATFLQLPALDPDYAGAALNCSTVTASTFTVTAPAPVGSVTGTIGCSGATATFTATLVANTLYTATLTTGIQNVAGTGLASPVVWTFTTDTQPTVLSAIPAPNATGVLLTQAISATFSKAMNCATIYSPATTFSVTGPGTTAVAGTVSCTGSGAIFTPTSLLATNTLYTATITTGALDAQGVPMANSYSWTFTTVPAAAAPTVISTAPTPSGVTGVAASQVVSATFSQVMNPSTIIGTTFTLTSGGTAVAGTVAGTSAAATFTPIAPLAANTTFTATLTSGVQSAAGIALASPYVWTFTTDTLPTVLSTVPSANATGVLLNQAISATFSKAMNCASLYSPATTFKVTGPGTTAVAGTVSCTGNGAIFTPSSLLATNTLYTATITTGATSAQGYPLATNYVWSFLTVPAPTAPTVIATVPTPSGVTGVATSQAVQATFSEAMNPALINSPAINFTLTAPGPVTVAGTVTYTVAGSVATFTPTAALAASTTYTATIKTGVQDLAGNALASNYVWTFTTGAAPDTTKPTVIAENPVGGATGVPTNQAVTATFSKAMNPATITITSPATFTLTSGTPAVAVAGLVTYAGVGNTLTFTPTAALAASTLYTATITTAAQDLSGNALASTGLPLSWSFTTGTAPVTAGPTITLTSPLNSATSVPVNQAVSATFSKAMAPLTINSATFTLTGPGGTAITGGTYNYNTTTLVATYTPPANLAALTTYTANITTGATDLAGNPLGSGIVPNPWIFTTAGSPGPPAVVLGTAALFGDFGGTQGMTNQGILTVVNGDIGTTAASTTETGFHDTTVPIVGAVWPCTYTQTTLNIGQVNGTIYTDPPNPTVNCPNEGTAATTAIAAQAALDTQAAYNSMIPANLPGGVAVEGCTAPQCINAGTGGPGELGMRTLQAGIYKSTPGTYAITLGPLTLDAAGNPNATWIFQMAGSLTVGGASGGPESIILINGAQAANVFWQVGSAATINGPCGGTFYGTVISYAGVTTGTAGTTCAITTINGRLLSTVGSVTLVNTVINVPAP
jgi:hypothetical protein